MDVRYVKWVNEFNNGIGDDVSRATTRVQLCVLYRPMKAPKALTTAVVELRRDAHARPVLSREGEV